METSKDTPMTVEVTQLDELVGHLLVHQCGCGGECGMRTPPYIKEAAKALARLSTTTRVDATDGEREAKPCKNCGFLPETGGPE